MINGKDIKQRVLELLSSGSELEDVLYIITQENLPLLPLHLQEDPKEVGEVLSGVQYYAHEVHPEFDSGARSFDLVLLRLIPKPKTEQYIQRLKDEA